MRAGRVTTEQGVRLDMRFSMSLSRHAGYVAIDSLESGFETSERILR